MNQFEERYRAYAALVEECLPGYLPGANTPQKSVIQAMRYSLCGGGKRMRAVLLLACFGLFQEDVTPALPFAAALEMVHAYSLIHDDLPCMDDDDMRRGRPACHIQFGESTALLAGDGLLTLAFETMCGEERIAAFGPQKGLEAVGILASAAGTGGMIGGQVMDLENEGQPVSRDRLWETDMKKTGALIRAAARIGCVLGGADQEQQKAAEEYAAQIGLAFQIVDDILDCTGDEALLGKPLHSDEQQGKTTYVTLYGLDKCRLLAGECRQKAGNSIARIGGDTAFLLWMADWLTERQN